MPGHTAQQRLAHGLYRFHCFTYGTDLLIPFSFKGRVFCPSCGGRRMAESAAPVVDHVERLEESGTHEELSRKKGRHAQLHELQFLNENRCLAQRDGNANAKCQAPPHYCVQLTVQAFEKLKPAPEQPLLGSRYQNW